jgi:hypothetical protein
MRPGLAVLVVVVVAAALNAARARAEPVDAAGAKSFATTAPLPAEPLTTPYLARASERWTRYLILADLAPVGWTVDSGQSRGYLLLVRGETGFEVHRNDWSLLGFLSVEAATRYSLVPPALGVIAAVRHSNTVQAHAGVLVSTGGEVGALAAAGYSLVSAEVQRRAVLREHAGAEPWLFLLKLTIPVLVTTPW